MKKNKKKPMIGSILGGITLLFVGVFLLPIGKFPFWGGFISLLSFYLVRYLVDDLILKYKK